VLLATSEISKKVLADISFMGLRSSIGVIFITAGMSKLTNPGFGGFLSNLGLPPEMQIPVALAEIVPGILLIIGVLSRISASLLSIIMLGAIFLVKEAQSLTGDAGYRIDLILLASCLVIIASGPGRVSLSQVVKKLPRILH
jgi:putative oxidoreductase